MLVYSPKTKNFIKDNAAENGGNQRAYQEIINHLRMNRALYSQNPAMITSTSALN